MHRTRPNALRNSPWNSCVFIATGIVAVAVALPYAANDGQQPTFRSTRLVVSVDVSVRTDNQAVAGLGRSDFVLYDNNVPQTIDSVSIGALPIDATFFLGTNNESIRVNLGNWSSDIRAISGTLGPMDRIRLLTLGNQVTDVFGWRASASSPPPIQVRVGGVQTLYDALAFAMLHRPIPDRRHVIIAISDGIEFGSVVDSTAVRELARRADAVLHIIFMEAVAPAAPNADIRSGSVNVRNALPQQIFQDSSYGFIRASWFHVMPDEHGLERLEEAARLTGGTAIHATSGTSIVSFFKNTFADFRQSYVIRYTPAGVSPTGWHDLRVEMVDRHPNITIRARKGYFAE